MIPEREVSEFDYRSSILGYSTGQPKTDGPGLFARVFGKTTLKFFEFGSWFSGISYLFKWTDILWFDCLSSDWLMCQLLCSSMKYPSVHVWGARNSKKLRGGSKLLALLLRNEYLNGVRERPRNQIVKPVMLLQNKSHNTEECFRFCCTRDRCLLVFELFAQNLYTSGIVNSECAKHLRYRRLSDEIPVHLNYWFGIFGFASLLLSVTSVLEQKCNKLVGCMIWWHVKSTNGILKMLSWDICLETFRMQCTSVNV